MYLATGNTLEKLYFTNSGIMDSKRERTLEYPQTALPENIKSFEQFRIDYFDNKAFNFFRRIQSVLKADTKLEICYIHKIIAGMDYSHVSKKDLPEQVKNIRFILGHLLPLIDGIHTMFTDNWMMPKLKSLLGDRFNEIKVFYIKTS